MTTNVAKHPGLSSGSIVMLELLASANDWSLMLPTLKNIYKINKKLCQFMKAKFYLQLENVSIIEFLYQIYLFSIQFFLTNWIQITKLKKLIQLFELNFNLNSTFLYQIKSNNWTVQVIEYFNFKSPNFFKYCINIKTNSVFHNYCQIWILNLLNLLNFLFLFNNCLNL